MVAARSQHRLEKPLTDEQKLFYFGGSLDKKDMAREISRMGQRELQHKFMSMYVNGTFSNNNVWLRRKLCEAAEIAEVKPAKGRAKSGVAQRAAKAKPAAPRPPRPPRPKPQPQLSSEPVQPRRSSRLKRAPKAAGMYALPTVNEESEDEPAPKQPSARQRRAAQPTVMPTQFITGMPIAAVVRRQHQRWQQREKQQQQQMRRLTQAGHIPLQQREPSPDLWWPGWPGVQPDPAPAPSTAPECLPADPGAMPDSPRPVLPARRPEQPAFAQQLPLQQALDKRNPRPAGPNPPHARAPAGQTWLGSEPPPSALNKSELQPGTPANLANMHHRRSFLHVVRSRPLPPERPAKKPLLAPPVQQQPVQQAPMQQRPDPDGALSISPSLLDLDNLDDLLPDPGFDLDSVDPLADLLPWPLEMPGLLPPMHHSPSPLSKPQGRHAAALRSGPAGVLPPLPGHAQRLPVLQAPAQPALQLQQPASDMPAARAATGLIPAVMASVQGTELEDEINKAADGQQGASQAIEGPASELPCSSLPQPGDNLALSLPGSPWPRRHPSFESAVNRAVLVSRAAAHARPEGAAGLQ